MLDIKKKTIYAAGAFTMGGFEKLAELNPQSPDHVMFAIAGTSSSLYTVVSLCSILLFAY